MKRFVVDQLVKWKISLRRKPLLIRGARQVGKTYSVNEFGENHFSGLVHTFNFEKNPGLARLFDENLDSNRILSEMELLVNARIIRGRDLVFFDEIQECPKAIVALRYFYEENPDLHVIAAGSLIEFALQNISFPVGRIQTMNMYPMNFPEFLMAMDLDLLANKIVSNHEPFSDILINKINTELERYYIVGGMPECVKTFAVTKSFPETKKIQTDLLTAFRQDFSKYAGHSDKRCLSQVLSNVAGRIGQQIKYSHLSDDFTQPVVKKAFELLEMARLFSRVKATSPSGLPLNASSSSKRFKIVFLDIGLLSNLSGHTQLLTQAKSPLNIAFRGMMAEQFVGQELRTSQDSDIFYWKRDVRGSSAEVDYLIESKGDIIPIEVKSGKAGRLTSLHLLMNTFPNIHTSIVFNENKYGFLEDKGIRFLPLFEVSGL